MHVTFSGAAVDGEPPAQEALAALFRERGHTVHIPAPGDTAAL